MSHVLVHPGWVDFNLGVPPSCPVAFAKLPSAQAESARQWNTQNPSQPNPGPRADGTPCTHSSSSSSSPLHSIVCLSALQVLFVVEIHYVNMTHDDVDVGHKFEYKAATCGGERTASKRSGNRRRRIVWSLHSATTRSSWLKWRTRVAFHLARILLLEN